MNFDRTGIILYTLHYQACVTFYEEVLQLKKMFENDTLTCFEFGSAYLMVEIDDEYDSTQPEKGRTRTCLRMNVPNVKALADRLKAHQIEVDYQEQAWGTIAKFYDPDGNLCAFKDSEKFEKQIADYQK
ncbi:MAG TPA: glyoxalase/bleomycin resistance/dioxygenase family protein [Microscillaceae bacterium]|nr:glyoxalase/bleomycin resistance/dioxygenase family protein [Microscillaceae bacterium]